MGVRLSECGVFDYEPSPESGSELLMCYTAAITASLPAEKCPNKCGDILPVRFIFAWREARQLNNAQNYSTEATGMAKV